MNWRLVGRRAGGRGRWHATLAVALAAGALLAVGGCSTPVGVRTVDPVPAALVASPARSVREPGPAAAPGDPLEAAEAEFARGMRLRHRPGRWAEARACFLAAMVNAWRGLEQVPGDATAPRAVELYNSSLLLALSERPSPGAPLFLQPGVFDLPPGEGSVRIERGASHAPFAEVQAFLPSAAFSVRGLSRVNRTAGLGVPLVCRLPDGPNGLVRTLAATLVARIESPPASIGSGPATVRLEWYPADGETEVAVGGRSRPLATDTTTPMAYALDDRRIWAMGRGLFFNRDEDLPAGLYPERPHQPGRIPVILVHGTISSPVIWAELVNSLRADPCLRDRYEFWFFIYHSGEPVSLSAHRLREELASAVAAADPPGRDPALRQMVLVGHSQGGLLVRLLTTDPGDALWHAISDAPFDQIHLPPEQLEVVRQSFFYRPMPGVTRAIFLGTPHRGSTLARGPLATLARLLLHVPAQVTRTTAAFLSQVAQLKLPEEVRHRTPVSIDDMSPTNPYLLALAALPPAPGVLAHSIIGIRGDQQPPDGTDGVVTYRSAHLDAVDSERVIRSAHGMQAHPDTVAEIRRILLAHACDE